MRSAIAIALAVSLMLSACADQKTICGVTYDTYGLLNSDDKKNPKIEYDLVWGNIIWSVLLVETIFAPIYFFGFSIFEPVGLKSAEKGAVNAPQDCPAKT